jgi:hypothetical protein
MFGTAGQKQASKRAATWALGVGLAVVWSMAMGDYFRHFGLKKTDVDVLSRYILPFLGGGGEGAGAYPFPPHNGFKALAKSTQVCW